MTVKTIYEKCSDLTVVLNLNFWTFFFLEEIYLPDENILQFNGSILVKKGGEQLETLLENYSMIVCMSVCILQRYTEDTCIMNSKIALLSNKRTKQHFLIKEILVQEIFD